MTDSLGVLVDPKGEQVLFKVLGENGEAFHGGTGSWFLPKGSRPGKWMPKIDNIAACERGYHVVTLAQLPAWLGPTIYEVEVRGDRIDQADKIVVAQARLVRRLDWSEKSARLFAADCAEHVLPIFEKYHPKDTCPRDAIAVARRFANGEATRDELDAAWAAARAAARDAARDAAGAAARDAACAAGWAAAWAAAGAAAGAAARAAAWAAGWAAEIEWQAQRFAFYLGVEG